MNRKVMAVMICPAVFGMMGNALAQQQAPVDGTSIASELSELQWINW
jgi:hypothetical protein